MDRFDRDVEKGCENRDKSILPSTDRFWGRCYLALEKTLVEPVKKNTFGYRYLVCSYLAHAKLKHKPVVITEWGADRDPDFARGQWEVLRKFPELRGIFFFEWGCVDWNRDGEIDGKELYGYLSEIEF